MNNTKSQGKKEAPNRWAETKTRFGELRCGARVEKLRLLQENLRNKSTTRLGLARRASERRKGKRTSSL
ncbi:MAG: hypothetical protein A3K06_02140 [Candidatus Doudnabacteria bacterium RIFCSPHIGHO2_01_52_17]|uniref:Uncharacterized protein n=1 Tax=Candidatus Doudnabacteria bacterium RIFCSPHIGHO2_01_52_17 TaxID=1817820 RepID=A0A1F5NBK7_9BACT|nr:MAG: hypothetical protein A3K06_02140 [Candidatus Doudnabacteria bacterium RIFCSPHIGHO2_01_52_17]